MGALCCCLRVEDLDEYVNPNSSFYRTCICLRCFVNAYTTLFRRGNMHAIPSSIESTTTLTSTTSHDNSLPDMYRSPPRPLPYDADPRCFRSQRDGLVSRREKGSSHSHEESEPLRRSDVDTNQEYLHAGDKWNESDEGGSKESLSESSMKHPLAMVSSGVGYVYSSSEEEDVCPTCLEEYTPENPKIMTQCSHHFHLVCIYEWMERSESCPVCGKLSSILLH
ncbi:zinc finger protein [Macleaya cordata]|uniref:RING-type E3 ubiquitin transferase n=1 Tax=Macleaya cordata TaxID=56857 RepID=A0A200QKM4_MACCD|nr:zinc finger protein [Macleaya cordata]